MTNTLQNFYTWINLDVQEKKTTGTQHFESECAIPDSLDQIP